MQPMKSLDKYVRRPSFFFSFGFGEGQEEEERDLLLFFCPVPNVFSSSFHGVLLKFPNVFPIAPHFHPIYALAKVVLLSYI